MPHSVSVIIPAYNAELYIADCLRSLGAQTFTDWEAVVVDDGSTDGTAAIVREFAERDNRIKYLFQANSGQGKARNAGVAQSNAPLVAFLDADDLWTEEKLALQIPVCEATVADIVYSDGFIIGDDAATDSFHVTAGKTPGANMFDQLLLHNSIPVMSVVMRRSTFDQLGGFDEARNYRAPCEDYDLWLRAAKAGSVFYGLPDRLVTYRRHAASTTSRQSEFEKSMLSVVTRYIDQSSLTPVQKKKRIRGLYRDLIASLVAEGQLTDAEARLKELAASGQNGIVTSLQKVLLRLSPASFNFVSRECLYRIEWHLGRLRRQGA